jgi:hypothetical protein
MLAWVEAFADEPFIPNINLVQQRFPALKEKARTVLALAFVRARSKMQTEALSLLDQLDTLSPDIWTSHGAQFCGRA